MSAWSVGSRRLEKVQAVVEGNQSTSGVVRNGFGVRKYEDTQTYTTKDMDLRGEKDKKGNFRVSRKDKIPRILVGVLVTQ